MICSILITPVQTLAVSVYGAPWEKKKETTKLLWLFPFTGVLHPFCISLDMFFSRSEQIHNAEIRAPLFKQPESSEEVRAVRWPFVGVGTNCSGRSHFEVQSRFWVSSVTSTQIRFPHEVPIYFLHRQASVKTLPRFEEMFDTIV